MPEPKPPKPNETLQQVDAESRELLGEFVEMFEAMPQKYCLFCEATGLGTELISHIAPIAEQPSCSVSGRRVPKLSCFTHSLSV